MSREEKLLNSSPGSAQHITGDEKGQAQIFLDRLFQAFGQPGCLDVGGQTEFRIRKANEDGGGTAFADYVWKPVVLIEMKKRGADLAETLPPGLRLLDRASSQPPALRRPLQLRRVPGLRLRHRLDAPKDTLALTDLPERWGPLAFLAPGNRQSPISKRPRGRHPQAADNWPTVSTRCSSAGRAAPLAQRFILQMLVALFAEDIDLLPNTSSPNLLEECKTPPTATTSSAACSRP